MLRIARSRSFFNGLRRNNRSSISDTEKASLGTSSTPPPAPSTSSSQQGINTNVAGLTSNCVKPSSGPVGRPGASATGEYKVPEYFCYSKISFAEAEVEMAKYRCPQPSALTK